MTAVLGDLQGNVDRVARRYRRHQHEGGDEKMTRKSDIPLVCVRRTTNWRTWSFPHGVISRAEVTVGRPDTAVCGNGVRLYRQGPERPWA